ncbi:MAG: chitobiase/beta-hexosaminidase C-terminal domain-containing protein, partial [bacterium]
MLNKGFLKLFIFTFISFSILSSCQFFSDEKKAAANSSTTVATPVITPASGAVVSGTEANITSETAGASIYYTIDGNNPTTSSTLYSTPIIINSALTIKAIAVKDGMTNSSISSGQYTIAQDTAFTPS